MVSEAGKVRAEGEEATIHITDQSVMFEKGGRISGFERSAIRMVKPNGDAMIIAYSVGSEVKSVRVEPLTAVTSLLSSGSHSSDALVPVTALDQVFEKLYWDTRKKLEEKLARVEGEPENVNLRLTPEEERKYSDISRQMERLLGTKYGFNPRAIEDSPISFWGLETQPVELQAKVVKTLHISFLRMIASPNAEKSDVVYSGTEVWPEDWSLVLNRFDLGDAPYLSDGYIRYVDYLRKHWEYRPAERKPALVRP